MYRPSRFNNCVACCVVLVLAVPLAPKIALSNAGGAERSCGKGPKVKGRVTSAPTTALTTLRMPGMVMIAGTACLTHVQSTWTDMGTRSLNTMVPMRLSDEGKRAFNAATCDACSTEGRVRRTRENVAEQPRLYTVYTAALDARMLAGRRTWALPWGRAGCPRP